MSKTLGLIAIAILVLMTAYLEVWVWCVQPQGTRGFHDLLVNTGCNDAAN